MGDHRHRSSSLLLTSCTIDQQVEKIFPRNEAVLRRTKKRKFWRQYKIFFRVISPEKKISTRGMINGSTQIKIVLVPMTIRVSAKQ
jgi:hypothetical protein